MSETNVRRASRSLSVTVGTTWSTSTTFPTAGMSGLAVTIHGTPSSAATVLSVFGSDDAVTFRELVGGTITLARITDGTSFTGVSACYSLPVSGFDERARLEPTVVVPFGRLVSDAELGTGVNVVVSLKS